MKTMSAVERWDYSRRIRPATAIDIAGKEFVIINEYGRKNIATAGRGVNKLDIIDFLPVKVMVKWNGQEFIIIDWEEMDHPSIGEQKEQMELDSWV
jgi:hypothetical protein